MQHSYAFMSGVLRNVTKETRTSAVLKESVRSFVASRVRLDSFKVQDQKDFQERVKNSKVPVVVDFFATWCNPCKMLTPRLESVIAEKKGKVLLAKVDIDENTELALDYEVGSVPALVAIKNGKVQERLVGLQDIDKLRKFVDQLIHKTD
ncbi:thioredoxin, mitochondrial [Zootermopsis nevadensis]|uniref:thioredoxin, mitochondrial n=1 Tax=Zootermopsis nevadensis TaxID=136037 RepID=UPI000B8EA438|nr:thioredoxin, mitochondrial [Zootermopsis nevadensis]